MTNADRVIVVTKQFDPVEFLGEDWSIWKGPIDGDGLSGDEDVDRRAQALTQIPVSSLVFKKYEGSGETKLRYLKATNYIRLSADVFLALWENYQRNRANSILEYLFEKKGIVYLDFLGTILRHPNGNRVMIYLLRSADGRWCWFCEWFIINLPIYRNFSFVVESGRLAS
ncbi:MAG: hypothetical protein AB1465_05365 [Patescibacteria group bacterium]